MDDDLISLNLQASKRFLRPRSRREHLFDCGEFGNGYQHERMDGVT